MNLIGSTFIALADDGRLFGLDYQLLLDAAITAFNVFILFVLLSYILFNPVRNMLKKRQDKITSDRESAKDDKQQAQTLPPTAWRWCMPAAAFPSSTACVWPTVWALWTATTAGN